MKQNPQKIELVKHTDGTVWRNGYCDCGKLMYKKCVTNNTVEFLVGKSSPGFYKNQSVQSHGDVTTNTITCPYCQLKHIVANISESIETQ